MPDALPPIPSPPSLRWREFRQRRLPFLVFATGGFAASVLWIQTVTPPTFVAEAETIRTEVRGAQAGTLADLTLDLLQPVCTGQVVARLRIAEPRVLAASLAVIHAEIELLRAGLLPVLPQQRVALDYERLQLDWMRERVALASLRAQLQLAEADLGRVTQLRQTNVVTVERFETATTLRDGLAAQIEAQTKLVAEIDPTAGRIGADGRELPRAPAEAALAAAIKVQEEKLKLVEAQLTPLELLAPIDGLVTAMHHRNGEALPAGEPVLTITAAQTSRLIGYLREPLPLEPRPGMRVEIRTRTLRRQSAATTISQVGRTLEPIPASLLAAANRPAAADLGLCLHLLPPPGLHLRPGEPVDVRLMPQDR